MPVNGVAFFAGLTLNEPGNGYTLEVTSGNLTPETSAAFNVTTTSTPTPTPPTSASAVATLSGGMVTSILITNGGNGYVTAPPVTIFGAEHGAFAAAVVANGMVTEIDVEGSGSGYTSAPIGQPARPAAQVPVTFVVTNTNDSGPGSLRQAIMHSNATLSSGNTIDFPIGTGPVTIAREPLACDHRARGPER